MMGDGVTIEPVVLFEDFYAEHYRGALALAWTLTGSRSSAEELTQDAFVEVYRRWGAISAMDNPGGYIRRVVSTRAASRWRRLGREAAVLTRFVSRASDVAPEPPPPDDEFWAAVRSLSPRQAQAVALFYLEDLSLAEIADTVTLGGHTGYRLVIAEAGGAPFSFAWQEGGLTFYAIGFMDLANVDRVLASLGPVDDAAWQIMLQRTEDLPNGMSMEGVDG